MRKILTAALLMVVLQACAQNQTVHQPADLKNSTMREYHFLADMYADSYFPPHLVDKGKTILVELCYQIEQEKPADLKALYKLTHAATERFNALQHEFDANGSELETAARESIAMDFVNIAKAYHFNHADAEEMIAPREW